MTQSHAAPRSHNVTTTARDEPAVPEPSFAERARTLVALGQVGALSTLSRLQPGFPFGSVMPYGEDTAGRPIFLISALAMHTQNLRADPKASLLVSEDTAERDPLGAGRVTLVGPAEPVPDGEVGEARELYLARYENARYWVDYKDFSFFRLEVAEVYFVGGFGVMGWVEAEEYATARPDPLAEAAPGIVTHMNDDHAEALVLLARHQGGFAATEATMTRVDRLGFHLRMKVDDRFRGTRLAFPREVRSASAAREVLVEMVRTARAAARAEISAG